ncbi:MAG TPA: BadF/BadG/BcrA/BcrD ATPase family protein [Gaiellaceae bacterium]|nr:BadF/BadG/BcrA/BcrD ATPase family protein [Gaiellaceae bacterium]
MAVIGVDGGNTKTDLVVATADGEPLAWVRGPGSNSHGPGGAAGCVEVIAALVERAAPELPIEHGAFFLCGADVPQDHAELRAELEARAWVRELELDNDTFALLHAGTDRPDAVAVVCGAGINRVGRRADGRIARYPALGWETGDWGGGEGLGREALFHAVRAEDGRGEPTVLVDVLRGHFGLPSATAVGEAVHYRRLAGERLGELVPAIVGAAHDGDAVALRLVERLADEIALLVRRTMRDLELDEADAVLGGGVLAGEDVLYELVVARLPDGARPTRPMLPPVAGAVLAALEAGAAGRFRTAFAGWSPE